MPDWVIVSDMNPGYAVRLGDCSREHADSVVADLLAQPAHPDDVRLVEGDTPPPSVKKSLFRRLIRG